MTDWLGTRTGRFFAREVGWPSFEEGADYSSMTGGSLELSAFSDTKAKGTLSYVGEPPDASKLLRVYYTFSDAEGASETVAVATMQVQLDDTTHEGAAAHGYSQSGKARLESMLKALADVELNAPYTIKAGSQAVAEAARLVTSRGLPVNAPEGSAYTVKADTTVKADDANLLAIVNKLLGLAGYSSAWVDAYGVVQLTPYVDPSEREVVFTFEEGARSVMLPEVPRSNDYASCPNVVRLIHSTDDEVLTASSSNMDPDHPASLPSRGGRELTLSDSVSELDGETADERLDALKVKARERLLDASSLIDYVTVTCPFLPLAPNDAVSVEYAFEWRGQVTNYTIDLGDDSSSRLKARRFVKRALVTEEDGRKVYVA